MSLGRLSQLKCKSTALTAGKDRQPEAAVVSAPAVAYSVYGVLPMFSSRIKAALWAVNLSTPVVDFGGWLSLIQHQLRRATDYGCDLLVMPEYACMQLLHYAPADLSSKDQPLWLGRQFIGNAGDRLASIPPYHQGQSSAAPLGILAGTAPILRSHGLCTNTAIWLSNGHASAIQDKIHLTLSETDPHGWLLSSGRDIMPFEYRGHIMAVSICHDNDVAATGSKLKSLGVEIVLAPSMCDSKSTGADSHEHIFAAARQRGLDAGAKVYAVGAIGMAGGETCWGGAAIYDAQGHTLGEIPAMKETDNMYGPMLVELDDGVRVI